MSAIKIGYLPLYIKLYDDSNPKTRQPLEAYMQTMAAMLRTQGLDVSVADVCRVKPEFDAAIDRFKAENVDAVVTQHLAYSPSLESIEALCRLDVPIIVLDTTPDYSLIDVAGHYNGINPNHGIHGVQDMCNLLRRRGREYYLCAGHALHSDVIARTAGLCRAAAAAKQYRTSRVGSVGGSFTGMGDFLVSDETYREKIGAKVVYLDRETAQKHLDMVSDGEIDAEIQEDAGMFTMEVKNEANYRMAVKSGLALRKWAQAENLSAYTVNFLTLDACGLPKMPFVECSKAMARGMGYAGEGDVLTAGLVGALRHVYPDTTFAEMFCPDWKANTLLISHMGEANLNLMRGKCVMMDVPFRYNSCGDTAAAYGCYRPGKAALVNVAPARDGFSMIVSEVELLSEGLEFGAYRDCVQGWMKPGKPLPQFLTEYSALGGTHHSALAYNVCAEDLLAFGRMMGFEIHQI